jgi:hypothetical protein
VQHAQVSVENLPASQLDALQHFTEELLQVKQD